MSKQNAYFYDAFVSYSHHNEDWVRNWLLPHLESADLHVCIDFRDFVPGAPTLTEIERAVSQSCKTLLILTPDYLVSEWTELENILVQTLDPAARNRRLIPLLLESCEPPLRIRALTHLDLTRPDRVDFELSRLIAAVGGDTELALTSRSTEPVLSTEISSLREPELVLVPAGGFLMGSDGAIDKDAEKIEFPQHLLLLNDFWISKTPITNGQYMSFVDATKYAVPEHWKGGRPTEGLWTHPVTFVSWEDALAYCNWLSEVTGKPYCLPTEAEWEKAARGTEGFLYPWGWRWNEKLCNTNESGMRTTTPVGTYPSGASPYGLLDCAGNVWEWCSTIEGHAHPYDSNDGRENLVSNARRVLRGGSWFNDRYGARCACRYGCFPTTRAHDVGFRVAREK